MYASCLILQSFPSFRLVITIIAIPTLALDTLIVSKIIISELMAINCLFSDMGM